MLIQCPRWKIATVTHLRGTQDFSVYGTRKVHDKLDIAKVSLLIVHTYMSIDRGRYTFKEARRISLRKVITYWWSLNIRPISNLISHGRFYLCKKRWVCDRAPRCIAYIWRARRNMRHCLMVVKRWYRLDWPSKID